ncbi:MAG: radical SAM protein [Bacteroidales bacterium]|nr:radical SAM protein [Bacteroidales bacterium]
MKKDKTHLSHISFEVNTACNLRCKYCYNIWKMPGAAPPEQVTYKAAKKAIKQLYKRATVDHFTFTGGEPMLFERLAELVLMVRLKGSTVTLISNGNAGTEEDFKMLQKLGVSLYEFPYHSTDPEIHDYLAGVKGAHEKSLKTIETVKNMGGRVVAVIVLAKQNIPTLQETLLRLKEMNVSSIMLNRFNIGGAGIEYAKDLMPTVEELRAAFKIANDTIRDHKIKLTSNVCSPICVLDPKEFPYIGFGHCGADPRSKPLTLDHNGNLRLCNHSPVDAGNIFKQSFEEIFESDYVKSWGESTPEFCDGCEHYNKCFAGCRAAAEQMGMTINGEDPVLQMLNIARPK